MNTPKTKTAFPIIAISLLLSSCSSVFCQPKGGYWQVTEISPLPGAKPETIKQISSENISFKVFNFTVRLQN